MTQKIIGSLTVHPKILQMHVYFLDIEPKHPTAS